MGPECLAPAQTYSSDHECPITEGEADVQALCLCEVHLQVLNYHLHHACSYAMGIVGVDAG